MKGNLIAIDPEQLRELQLYCKITDGSVENCIAEALSEFLYVVAATRTEASFRKKGSTVVNELGAYTDLIQ